VKPLRRALLDLLRGLLGFPRPDPRGGADAIESRYRNRAICC